MKTKWKQPFLFLPIAIGALAGCNTVTHSPVVYTSRQSVGVDIRPTASDTVKPGISIGVRSSDFAWVPAVGIGGCVKWKDGITIQKADREYTSRDWHEKCESEAYQPRPLLARSDERHDVFSVFGQFDANVGGFALPDSGKLAKVFAIGMAAERYTSQSSAKIRNECLLAVDKLIEEKIEKSTDADVKAGAKQIAASLKQQCGVNLKKENP